MIDLHCHLLAGIDDGPADIEASLELARAAQRDGTETIAATPHLRADHPQVRPHELAARCAALRERIAEAGLPLRIVSGGEVDTLWAQRASDEDLRLASFGQRGADLLLETPYGPLPDAFENLVFALTLRGYRILLAHPDRNPTFQRDPERLAELVRRGALVQVTALSLANPERGSRSRRMALGLVERGLAHVIASDSHAADWRAPNLSAGVEAAARLAPRRARWMVTDAPAAVLAGAPLPEPPDERPRRGPLGFRRGRRWAG